MNDSTGHTDLRRLPRHRAGVLAAALAGTAWLAGCASLNTVHSEVSSFGQWPLGRAAGSFTIQRLPSQQTPDAEPEQTALEQGAQAALQSVGFVPAAEGTAADVVVQIGARVTRQDRAPWDDPLWWSGPYGGRWAAWGYPGLAGPYGYSPYGFSPYWSARYRYPSPEYQREVAVLIRDRASGEPLYEARARSDGISSGGTTVLSAMFSAALQGFPAVQPEPHPVQVALP